MLGQFVVLLRWVILDEHLTVTYPPISFFWVALRRTVPQVASRSFRNALAKVRNHLVEMRKGLIKCLVLMPAVDLIDGICKHMYTWKFSFLFNNSNLCILIINGAFFSKFLWWKILLIFCLCYFLFCRCANNQFDVHFWWITPINFFCRKMEKTRSMKRKDGEVFFSRQSRHFSFLDNMNKVLLPYLYLEMTCKQVHFVPRKSWK